MRISRSWWGVGLVTALAVAVFGLVGLAGLVPATATTASGYCSGAGVSVAVDFAALGGGVQKRCDTRGDGKSAWAVFDDAGFRLTGVQRQPGAVCRVSGKPASAPCAGMPPTDAYWGLFSSTGSGWIYASVGAGGLTVHDGDTVAFAWQSTSGHRAPNTSPAPRHVASPNPTPGPAQSSTKHGHATSDPRAPRSSSTAAGQSQAPSSAVPTPAASAGKVRATSQVRSHSHKKRGAASRAASVDPSPVAASVRPTAQQSVSDGAGSGLPWWIPAGIVVVLAAAGGGVVLRRRSQ